MGIGKEQSNSDIFENDNDNDIIHPNNNIENDLVIGTNVKTLNKKNLELQVAGKPWPVASQAHCFVICIQLLLILPFSLIKMLYCY